MSNPWAYEGADNKAGHSFESDNNSSHVSLLSVLSHPKDSPTPTPARDLPAPPTVKLPTVDIHDRTDPHPPPTTHSDNTGYRK